MTVRRPLPRSSQEASVSVTVRIPTILRTYTGGAAEVGVDPAPTAAGPTLLGVLEALEGAHPGIRARVLDDDGRLRRFVNVYVDDEDVRFADGLQTPTPAGAAVSVIPAVAGG
jgi:molybdopterin converting factor small subunit